MKYLYLPAARRYSSTDFCPDICHGMTSFLFKTSAVISADISCSILVQVPINFISQQHTTRAIDLSYYVHLITDNFIVQICPNTESILSQFFMHTCQLSIWLLTGFRKVPRACPLGSNILISHEISYLARFS